MTQAVALAQQASIGVSPGFRNRIINGGMTIDQRNAGASVTVNGVDPIFTLDRYGAFDITDGAFTVQQVSTAPTGFVNSLQVTITTADTSLASNQYSGIYQSIEGFNTADLMWGTANAQTVTLSFWVRSSLTGTFGGSLRNSASNRSYPFTYTISAANTWEQKSITIAGDTTGTWLTTNGIGIRLSFGLGVGTDFSGTAGAWAAGNFISATGATSVIGTNGATWFLTGVQLEVGSTATSFDYRPYGTELALCQRYYQKNYLQTIAVGANSGSNENQRSVVISYAGSEYSNCIYLKQTMRATPAVSLWNDVGTANSWTALPAVASRTVSAGGISDNGFSVSAATTGDGSLQGMWAASAEL